MAYATAQLKLLTGRLVADGQNEWIYDDTAAPATVIAAGYISDAEERGVAVGDKITYRRFSSLTTKSSLTSVTEHWVSAVSSSGATLTAEGGRTYAEATASSGAATANAMSGQITSESLTTAAAAEYTLTLTNSAIEAGDMVFASVDANGSAGTPGIGGCEVSAGSVEITVTNLHASAAFDGPIKINFLVVKAG